MWAVKTGMRGGCGETDTLYVALTPILTNIVPDEILDLVHF